VVNPDNGLAFRRSDVAAALATVLPPIPVPSLSGAGAALLAVALFAVATRRLAGR
jgi:hypothetical protein